MTILPKLLVHVVSFWLKTINEAGVKITWMGGAYGQMDIAARNFYLQAKWRQLLTGCDDTRIALMVGKHSQVYIVTNSTAKCA